MKTVDGRTTTETEMVQIVTVQRWRRMSPAAKHRWIEYAVKDRLDFIQASSRELSDFERIQLSGALSGALSGFYDFSRLCLVLVNAPSGINNIMALEPTEDLHLLGLPELRAILGRIAVFPPSGEPLF